MSDTLARICGTTRAHVAACRERKPLRKLEAMLPAQPCRGFIRALKAANRAGRSGLIAEIKRSSPSRGLIRADFDPPSLALAYAAGGATCLSVLTDIRYFGGAVEHLVAARKAVTLPVLRKDFTLDPYQVVEARVAGADAVLLIMAALGDVQARELEACAHDLGLDVLVEVHNRGELDRALRLRSPLIGINNRSLKSLEVDLGTTERLAPLVPADRLLVCESGVTSHADLLRMKAAGASCFLVGESLMRQPDVTAATAALLGLGIPVGAFSGNEHFAGQAGAPGRGHGQD